MDADERRILNDIANKRAIEQELKDSDDANLRAEAQRQAQEVVGLQKELHSRRPNH